MTFTSSPTTKIFLPQGLNIAVILGKLQRSVSCVFYSSDML